MIKNPELFKEVTKLDEPKEIELGDGNILKATAIGDVQMDMLLSEERITPVVLKDVLYVPELKCNLFSISCATNHGNRIEFTDKRCTIWNRNN